MDEKYAQELLDQIETLVNTIYAEFRKKSHPTLHHDWDYTRYEMQRALNHYRDLIDKTVFIGEWR